MSAPVTQRAAPLWHGVGEVPADFGPCVEFTDRKEPR